MAGDWIPMQKDLWACPEVVRILSAICPQNVHNDADKCPQGVRIMSNRLRTKCEIIGALFRTWSLFDTFSDDGKLHGYDAELLNEEVGIQSWAENLCHVGWLKINADSLEMPGFSKHLDQSAKRRMKDAQRKAEARKNVSAKCPQNVHSDADKMRTTEEKRREEKNIKEEGGIEIPPSEVRGYLPCIGGQFAVTHEFCRQIHSTYPHIDLTAVFKSMKLWLESNPTKRKTAKGMKRFITAWFAREAEKQPKPQPKPKTVYAKTIAQLQKERREYEERTGKLLGDD